MGSSTVVVCVCLSVCQNQFYCLNCNNSKTKSVTAQRLHRCMVMLLLHRTVTAIASSMD